ncbi:hypothetical protein [Halomonas caseinilytica]|uniref:hypothetical protein n=1 Tax=Halomonas caseinilytica TaxID=438744 RepID=UPI0007E53506|nr:hypothetical protein [Halomonas caseinilytica]SEN65748.1 hypothetical protein SAMN04487952_12328 [Halomonas caseinilytica]
MQLIHTSPSEITEINSFGRFGEFLFFSEDEYVMTAGEHVTYSIEIDEDDIIEAGQLFYHDDAEKLDGLVQAVMDLTGCEEDTAEELIAQNEDVHSIDCDIEPEDLAEASWDIQRIAGEAAVILGYRGVEMEDEQGTAYLINMKGREADLEIA